MWAKHAINMNNSRIAANHLKIFCRAFSRSVINLLWFLQAG